MSTTQAIKTNKRASAVASLTDPSEIIIICGYTAQEILPIIIISITIFFINVTQYEILLFSWQTLLFSIVFFEVTSENKTKLS